MRNAVGDSRGVRLDYVLDKLADHTSGWKRFFAIRTFWTTAKRGHGIPVRTGLIWSGSIKGYLQGGFAQV
jgi:hypothetical protein